MRIVCCGSRTYDDRLDVFGLMQCLMDGIRENHHGDGELVSIVHGAAPGADTNANDCAIWARLPVAAFPANWDKHGKAAGPIRNQQMLDEGKPDLVLAFIDKPLEESSGTNDMVTRAMRAGIPTYVVRRMT